MIVISIMILTGCSAKPQQEQSIGMANPAAVNCIKLGGYREIVKNATGETGYCNLPSGERIEEWQLYRRGSSK